MQPKEFFRLATLLTGTPIKAPEEVDIASLASILVDDRREIDCSQFNELLLLVHKDRVQKPFFEFFFGCRSRVGEITSAVERFQKAAMLRFGNFVFAYRTLSRIRDTVAFVAELEDAGRVPDDELASFNRRGSKLVDIDPIERHLTPLVGYLSAGRIRAEHDRCELLLKALDRVGTDAKWETYIGEVNSLASEAEGPVLGEIMENYRRRFKGEPLTHYATFLKESLAEFARRVAQVKETRRQASQNQETYLTWDHMDVYFATSMRKAWEYEDLYDFVNELLSHETLLDLKPKFRFFDPTQSFTDNRVNKGLVEALMLKRARCTVYSVQDTDTLGKDSELAATLAQGKPVIAYVPEIDVEKRTAVLLAEDPETLLERLRFVLYADENFTRRLSDAEYDLVDRVQDELEAYLAQRIWLSLPDATGEQELKDRLQAQLSDFCRIVGKSEKAIYDKRTKTLRHDHPLAIQVNLDTGVANGLLVVRTVPECAVLLRRILLYDMDFDLEETSEMWYLRERVSRSIFRVVTKSRKLDNSFWNFYLQSRNSE